jgi:hypothetical protein
MEMNAKQSNFSNEIAKFPARFISPILIGNSHIAYTNGTISLIEYNGIKFGITNYHVIEEYINKSNENINIRFQIAYTSVNPLPLIRYEIRPNDIVALDLNEITIINANTEIGRDYYPLRRLPPNEINPDDLFLFGGFPGCSRNQTAINRIELKTFTLGPTPAHSIDDDKITFQLERGKWHSLIGEKKLLPQIIGGLSGGLAFVVRNPPKGILNFEFVGIIGEQNSYDIL